MYEDDGEAKTLANSLFKALDANKNGVLEQRELRRARTIMLVRGDDPQIKLMTEGFATEADEDGDGKVSKEEWHEFVSALYSVMGKKQFVSLARYWVSNSGAHLPQATKKAKKCVGPADKKPEDATGQQPAIGWNASWLAAMEAIDLEDGGEEPGAEAQEAPAPQPKLETEVSTDQAAAKIQALFRGKASRKKVAAKPADAEPGAGQHVVNKLSTIGDLWDRLTQKGGGQFVTSILVEDFIDMFTICRRSGLDMELANTVPMTSVADGTPEDLSAGEVSHLCSVLANDPELSEHKALQEIAGVRDVCRGPDMRNLSGSHLAEPGSSMRRARLKLVIDHVARLMCIDPEYIVTQMCQQQTGVFELTDTLAALLHECMNTEARKDETEQEEARSRSKDPRSRSRGPRSPSREPGSTGQEEGCGKLPPPDLTCLKEPFTQTHFMRLMYKGGLVDADGEKGLPYGDVQLVWKKTEQQLPERLAERNRKLKRSGQTKRCSRDGFVGSVELAVLLEELASKEPVKRLFPGPLHLTVRLLQRMASSSDRGG